MDRKYHQGRSRTRGDWDPLPFPDSPYLLQSFYKWTFSAHQLYRSFGKGHWFLEKTDLIHTWSQYQIPESEFHCSACVQLSTVMITGSYQIRVASRRWLHKDSQELSIINYNCIQGRRKMLTGRKTKSDKR